MFDFGSDDELCDPADTICVASQEEAEGPEREDKASCTSGGRFRFSSSSSRASVSGERRDAWEGKSRDSVVLTKEELLIPDSPELAPTQDAGTPEHDQDFVQMDLSTLKGVYYNLGLPSEPDMQVQDYVNRLSNNAKWQKMQLHELQRECDRCGVSTNGLSLVGSGSQQRQVLAHRLRDKMCVDVWESKGIPVRRLGCLKAAAEVVTDCARLSEMTIPELEAEYRECGMPVEANMKRADLLVRCRTLLFWSKFSLQELLRECQIRKVSVSQVNQQCDNMVLRQELLMLLLKDICAGACAAKGIPMHRLASVEVAAKLMVQYDCLARLSNQQLREECMKFGCFLEPTSSRQLLLETMQRALLWMELPLAELRKECEECIVQGAPTCHGGSEEEEHRELVGRLQLAVGRHVFEEKGIPVLRLGSNAIAAELLEEFRRLETMSTAAIRRQYGHLGLPWNIEGDTGNFLLQLKTVLVWGKLPSHELRKECRDRGIATSGLACWGEEVDIRQALVRRLEIDLCADIYNAKGVPAKRIGCLQAAARVAQEFSQLQEMSLEELKAEFAKLGAPWVAKCDKLDAISCLQELSIWKELPTAELQRECQERGLPSSSSSGLGRAGEQQLRRQLAARLFLAQLEPEEEKYASREYYENMGIPVQQLGSVKVAKQIAERFERIDTCTADELRDELRIHCLAWDDIEKTDLVSYVKQAAVWTELPLAALRAECRSRRIPFSGGDGRRELVRRLLSACHAAREPRQSRSQSEWRQAAPPARPPEPLSPRIAKCFAALDVPECASSADVGKAFRRLALKFHPDKNSGSPQEDVAAEFRAIAEAYETLSEHLKAQGR